MAIMKVKEDHFKNMCKHWNYTDEEVKDSIVKIDQNGTFSYTDKDGNEQSEQAVIYYVDSEHKSYPHSHGPGTELKKMFSMVGIKATPTCSCNRRAGEMDNRGIEWCKNNKEEILGWLEEEATKRKMPFVKFGADCVVNLAIKKAMKDPRSKP